MGRESKLTLSIEQGVLSYKMIFFCVYCCEEVFFNGNKLNFAKHSITCRIRLQSNVDIRSQFIFVEF